MRRYWHRIMNTRILLTSLCTVFLVVACRSNNVATVEEAMSLDSIAENMSIRQPDVKLPDENSHDTKASVPVKTIEYYTNNHACPRLHTDEACRKEAMLNGMLMYISIKDKNNHQLNLKTLEYLDGSNELLEGSLLEWFQPYDNNYLLKSEVGNIDNEYNVDYYKTVLKLMIPAPPNSNLKYVDDYYEYADFGPNNSNSFVTYDENGHPVAIDEYSTYYSLEKERTIEKAFLNDEINRELLLYEKSKEKPLFYEDPDGQQWKYLVRHTYMYDTFGRLVQHAEKDNKYFEASYIDQYEYNKDNEACIESIFHYSDREPEPYLLNKIQYLDWSPDVLRYESIELKCTDSSMTNCSNGTPAIWEESRQDCPEHLEWILPDAVTQYDRQKNTWISPREMISTKPSDDGSVKYYSPDAPFDFNDVTKHYYAYELDPRYSFEPRDYEALTDPDASHLSRAFWMSPKVVTQKEFAGQMGFNPSYFQSCGEDCPVENVTWYQALAYSNALSVKEKREACYQLEGCTEHFETCETVVFKGLDCKGYRLPTDEEWRSMARKIDEKADQIYKIAEKKWFNQKVKSGLYGPEAIEQLRQEAEDIGYAALKTYIESIMWYLKNGESNMENCVPLNYHHNFFYKSTCVAPHPVGQKKADPNGLFDFYGNVFEWIWDWYGYTSRSGDSLGPDRGYCRIMRGGSVFSEMALVNHRFCYPPNRGGSVLSFRLVRTL